MAEGFVHGQRLLLAIGEAIEVLQNVELQIPKLEIQLAPTPQFTDKQQQSPPEKKSGRIGHHLLEPRIG